VASIHTIMESKLGASSPTYRLKFPPTFWDPPAGSRYRAPDGQGVRRQKPHEAEALLAFRCSVEASNLPTFLKFGNANNQIFVLSLQEIMGGYETGGLEQNWGRACAPPRPGPTTATGPRVRPMASFPGMAVIIKY